MTFGKRLLLHLYAIQFLPIAAHTYPLPLKCDQTERQEATASKEQQKMPHCPFYPTHLSVLCTNTMG